MQKLLLRKMKQVCCQLFVCGAAAKLLYALYFLSKSLCQCLLRSGNTLGMRIFLKSSMHFFRSSSSNFLSSSSSSSRGGGAPFSLGGSRGSVFRLRVVGRCELSRRGGVGVGGLEVKAGLAGSGGGKTGDDGSGSSEMLAARGGGGGSGGVNKGGGRSRGCPTSSNSTLLVSGRLWVRPGSGWTAASWDNVTWVRAGESEISTSVTTDEPPAPAKERRTSFKKHPLHVCVVSTEHKGPYFEEHAKVWRTAPNGGQMGRSHLLVLVLVLVLVFNPTRIRGWF